MRVGGSFYIVSAYIFFVANVGPFYIYTSLNNSIDYVNNFFHSLLNRYYFDVIDVIFIKLIDSTTMYVLGWILVTLFAFS